MTIDDEMSELHAKPKHIIELDDYEVANLRWLLGLVMGENGVGIGDFACANTGDWVGQIRWKLPSVSHKPNRTKLDLEESIAWGKGKTLNDLAAALRKQISRELNELADDCEKEGADDTYVGALRDAACAV